MNNRTTAEKLFTNNMFYSMGKMSNLFLMRRISRDSSKYNQQILYKECFDFIKDIHDSPDRGFFSTDDYKKEFFRKIESIDSVAMKMTDAQIKSYKNFVDASCVIFAHSILDNSAYECCRMTYVLSFNVWEKDILKRKVTLDEVKSKAPAEVIKDKCDRYIKDFEKESLPAKIDRIFCICKPDSNFDPIDNYKFDMDKIREFDRLRHSIIHHEIPDNCMPNGDMDIDYFNKTNFFLYFLINKYYDLKFNPTMLDIPKNSA